MTANQLKYWDLQEQKRANLAKEQETQRSNLAKELETNRANVVREEMDRPYIRAKTSESSTKSVENITRSVKNSADAAESLGKMITNIGSGLLFV